MRARGAAAVLAAALVSLSACSDDAGDDARTPAAAARTETVRETTRVEVVRGTGTADDFDPSAIYRRAAPGVVTVVSIFDGGRGNGGSAQRGLGSGFVISARGEVATNAHVVTDGTGASIRRARQVYVEFRDGNEVPARIVGYDPNSDIALLRIDPAGLTLRPLPLGESRGLKVGSPVAAIGSPFGEPQSLSVGVVSATKRSIESLTGFAISGAIQTDAAVNRGNSGGPLVDARGAVVGINSQIQSTGGGGEGVGFAVPADTVRRAVTQLRRDGRVRYAYIGVKSVSVFPQLAERLGLQVERGAFVQTIEDGSPGDKAGLRAGERTLLFHSRRYRVGGDVIAKVDDHPIHTADDLGYVLGRYLPGDRVSLEVWRGRSRRVTRIVLGERPASSASRP